MALTDTIADQGATLDSEAAALAKREGALATAEPQRLARQDAEMAPLQQGLQSAMDAPMPTRQQVDMPKPPDLQKLVDPKEFEGLGMALVGMSLIGGAVSKGNWLGVSSALNGALKGYHDGNEAVAQRELQRYETEFKSAKAREDQANKEYDDVLKNRNLSINEQLSRIKTLATQHGREDIRMAAEQKSIDTLHRQIDAGRTQLAGVQQRNDAVQTRMRTQTALHQLNSSGGGQLDENGQWVVEQAMAGGDQSLIKMASGRYSAKTAVPILNAMGARMKADGEDPRDMTAAKFTVAADAAAQRVATGRLQAVDRLTSSVKTLEDRVRTLTTQLNGSGVPAANHTLNAVRQQFGDGPLQELKTLTSSVGRQYVEAVTMPGSNAQMHATAQDWSTGLLNENMPVQQLEGTLRAMNAEIEATHKALQNQVKSTSEGVSRAGTTIPRPGGDAAPKAVHWDDLK